MPCCHAKNTIFTPVFDDRSSFRAKGLSRHTQNRNFTFQFLAIEACFVRKGCRGTLKIAILFQFLAIEARFVRKGCRGTLKIAILLFSFWRSKLFSCERVVAAHSKSQFYFSVFGDRSSFRAKGLSRHTQNRNFTSVFGERVAFRAVSLALPRAVKEK